MSLADQALEAVLQSVDRRRLEEALARLVPGSEPAAAPARSGPAAAGITHRIVMSDLLDEGILGARPGDDAFPLRLFFGALGERIEEEDAFTLASGLNFFFRADVDDEAKIQVGLGVSRLYYRFASTHLEADLRPQLSPLVARLMSTQLAQVRFEAVDGARVFDSSVHERAPGSDPSGSRVVLPVSFLCRVAATGRVRLRARVRT